MQKGVVHLLLLGVIGFFIAVGVGYILLNKSATPTDLGSEVVENKETPEPVSKTAGFTVYTRGTRRNFSASMYIKKSVDVYIENPDPSIIQIKKGGVTWNDFFKTLPMELTNNCLTTGTGEKFCDGEGGELKFFLNTEKVTNILDKEIVQDDFLEIRFE